MADDKQSTSSEQCPDCQEDKMCDACAEVIGSGSSDSEEANESDARDYDVGATRAEIHHHYQNYHFYDFRQQHQHYYMPPVPCDAPPPNNWVGYPPPDFDHYRSESASGASSDSESQSDEKREESQSDEEREEIRGNEQQKQVARRKQ